MKPATYTETVEIVKAFLEGTLKTWTADNHISPSCARMRIMRFKRQHPEKYVQMKNVTFCYLPKT